MEDSCEMWHTNAQCHKTKRQKDVVTSTSEMCVGSLEKAKIVPGAIKGQLVSFQESRMAKQCLDAGKSTGSRQGNTHTTNGTFYRHGSTVQTSRFSITMLALNCCLRNSETELQLRQQIQP